MVFSADGILFLLDEICLLTVLSRQDSVVVVKPSARHEHTAVDACVGADARHAAVTVRAVAFVAAASRPTARDNTCRRRLTCQRE